MKIADSRIVAALLSPKGKAAFDRAPVIVESNSRPGTFLQVRAYVSDDEMDGKLLGMEELEALLRTEQAIRMRPMPATMGVALWALRPSFEGREAALEALRMSGGLWGDKEMGPDGSFLCVVREEQTNRLRDEWAQRAFDEARSWAKAGRWARALEFATRAFVIERAMSSAKLAMLSFAHERCGNGERAAGYLAMARRSRGETFEAEVKERKDDLAREFGEREPESGVRPRNAPWIQRDNSAAMRAGLERLRKPRAA